MSMSLKVKIWTEGFVSPDLALREQSIVSHDLLSIHHGQDFLVILHLIYQ